MQGRFVGAVTDNFGETIEQKIFHAQIVVDNEAVQKETAAYQPIPEISSFLDEDGNDTRSSRYKPTTDKSSRILWNWWKTN